MKHVWSNQELEEHWFLEPDERQLVSAKKPARSRIGFALLLKFFQLENRFPTTAEEIPPGPLKYVAEQLGSHARLLDGFDFAGRTVNNHHREIRQFTGWRGHTADDGQRLTDWLVRHVLLDDPDSKHVADTALAWYRNQQIEPPPDDYLDRLIRTAVRSHEEAFVATIHASLTESARVAIDALLAGPDTDQETEQSSAVPTVGFNDLKADPGRPGLESVLREVAKLKRIDQLELPATLFSGHLAKFVTTFRRRVATEPPSELKLRVEPVRYTLVAAFCWQRRREILDGLVELLIQIVHRIGVKADKKVEKELLEDFRKVRGKTGVLFKMAEAALEHPDGVIEDVLCPVVGVQTLKDLVKEFKSTGPAFRETVHTVMRASYSSYYRRILPHLLDALPFRSNNAAHRPIIEALGLLTRYRESRAQYFPQSETVPAGGGRCQAVRESGTGPDPTRPIQWDLIAHQYDEMIKYTTALRIGSADPESILRRFTRGNIQHPTYRALAELGKAVKTIFLCRYLQAEELRREIHEGLNVVENWNSANSFIFYGKGGEVASNQLEDHELSVLSLHLVHICLVYVNTLMIQRILADTNWRKRLKVEDYRALSPLIYAHINPYGRFDLDMNTRLPLDNR